MKKVILDSLNTLDSVEWQHKGYTVFLNYGPGNGEKYFICRPDQEKACLEAPTLALAAEVIEADLKRNN